MTWAQVASESNLDLDVLFIVDDTSAIAGSRGLLTAAYPQIAQLFEGILGGLLSNHLGVAAASLGAPPSCDVAASGPPLTRAGACGGSDVSASPCWVFGPGDDNDCPGRLAFSIERPADFCPQHTSVVTVATCLGCVDPEDPACGIQP